MVQLLESLMPRARPIKFPSSNVLSVVALNVVHAAVPNSLSILFLPKFLFI